jgi:hypothetical protein
MKWMSLVVVVGLAVAVAGCGESGSVKGPGGEKFKVTAPGPVTVTQGESAKFTVKATRNNFDDPIDLRFSDLPSGTKVVESDTKLGKGATSAEFTLQADEKATPVEGHKASLTASAGDQKVGPLNFTVNVKAKK